MDDESKGDLFLCRNNFDQSYVLTNKNDFEVSIQNQYISSIYNVNKAILTENNTEMFLLVSFGIDNQFVRMIHLK